MLFLALFLLKSVSHNCQKRHFRYYAVGLFSVPGRESKLGSFEFILVLSDTLLISIEMFEFEFEKT